jgi:hypothetical protein
MATGKMTNEIETRLLGQNRRAMALMGNLTAVLGLLVLGFPLTPSAIRARILMIVAIAQFIWGDFQTAQSPVSAGPRPSTRLTTLALRRGIVVQSLRGSR